MTQRTISRTPAVVLVCERCGRRSDPLDPERAEAWEQRHAEAHEKADRRERLAELGHEVHTVTERMVEDDSSGYAWCSCGWRSRSAKTCWTADFADGHLADVEAGLA